MKFAIAFVAVLFIASFATAQLPGPTPEPCADPLGSLANPLQGTGTIDFDKAVVWDATNGKTITDVKWTKGNGEEFYKVKADVIRRVKDQGVWKDMGLPVNGNAELSETVAASPWKNQNVNLNPSGAMVVRISLITKKDGMYYLITKDSPKKLYDRNAKTIVEQAD